jgi:DNA-directed RNA polymerase specialized sigma24 family protein
MDFGEIRYRKMKIDSINERILRLRSAMETGTCKLDGIKKNIPQEDRLAESIAKLIELEDDLLQETINLEACIREVECSINNLPEQQRLVIRLRDIDGMNWIRISQKMHYDERHCRRIHNKAMENLKNNDVRFCPV